MGTSDARLSITKPTVTRSLFYYSSSQDNANPCAVNLSLSSPTVECSLHTAPRYVQLGAVLRYGKTYVKARFPLPELTARINGPSWRVTGFHYQSTRVVLTGARFPLAELTGRQMVWWGFRCYEEQEIRSVERGYHSVPLLQK